MNTFHQSFHQLRKKKIKTPNHCNKSEPLPIKLSFHASAITGTVYISLSPSPLSLSPITSRRNNNTRRYSSRARECDSLRRSKTHQSVGNLTPRVRFPSRKANSYLFPHTYIYIHTYIGNNRRVILTLVVNTRARKTAGASGAAPADYTTGELFASSFITPDVRARRGGIENSSEREEGS